MELITNNALIHSWVVLVPAMILLLVTFITKRLNLALIAGIISAALIATNFAIMKTAILLAKRFYYQLTDIENIYLYIFLLTLGIIIALLEYSGGATAFARLLTTRLKSKKMVETSSLLLSSTLFIDDYLSCLVSGFVMRPLTDKFSIPRTKLAYLIHSLSGPLVILAPISSWVALITSSLDKAGVSPAAIASTKIVADPFYVYLQSIPFIFYSLLTIATAWFIVRAKISYGPMHTEEQIAQETGNLFGGHAPIAATTHDEIRKPGHALDLVLPIFILIATFIIGIAFSGGYYLFGGTNSFLQAVQKNTQTPLILCIAGLVTLAISLLRILIKKTIAWNELPHVVKSGLNLMQSSIMMVFLASTFGIMIRQDLHVGTYLASTFLHAIHLFLLPLIFYVISIIVALITGSAWGTIALMVPICVQMLVTLLSPEMALLTLTAPIQAILFPTLGAIFSGAVCGNHISPIAETTIMSSNSAGCYPVAHAYTQFWYALPAVVCAGISFLAAGLLQNYGLLANAGISLAIGLACCISIVFICNKVRNK